MIPLLTAGFSQRFVRGIYNCTITYVWIDEDHDHYWTVPYDAMILQIWISPTSPLPLHSFSSSVFLPSEDEGVTSTSKSSDPTDRGVPHDRGDSSIVPSKDQGVAFNRIARVK